ncbi:calcium-binding protein [Natrinema sp. 1APR25-10V2]|uniref:calcium-binding protein n=1 Tax=Natrinema sp. 1APR25-10V2 TaxID=2951081 RepID=UPI002874D518|nr:calcium-binding protein [Natrinema sp. 1APR25-10V2]MDS0474837.1 calcium-binding protein [Natrinema sp. 1APR25-10V2]
MAKSALVTGALTLGTAAYGTATVAAQQEQVAVFADNYYPGANFDVVDPLQQGTTVDILQVDDEPVAEISQPDEWTGHIIRYDIGQGAGITTFLFVRGSRLSRGDSGTIGPDASVLSSDLNLLDTSLGNGGGTGGSQAAEGNQAANETPNENGGGE